MAKKAAEEFEEFHVYRHFRRGPYRWACCLVPEPSLASGFKIIDSDPAVADSVFLTRLDQAMRQPQEVMVPKTMKDGIYDMIETINPGDPGFIEAVLYGLQIDNFAHHGAEPQR